MVLDTVPDFITLYLLCYKYYPVHKNLKYIQRGYYGNSQDHQTAKQKLVSRCYKSGNTQGQNGATMNSLTHYTSNPVVFFMRSKLHSHVTFFFVLTNYFAIIESLQNNRS
jgi:hypothetical protein